MMVVGAARSIADYAQAKKRQTKQIARLSNGGALHIASHSVWEIPFYGILPFAVGNELVASAYQTSNQTFTRSEPHVERMVKKALVGIKASRQALDLTNNAIKAHATIDASTSITCICTSMPPAKPVLIIASG